VLNQLSTGTTLRFFNVSYCCKDTALATNRTRRIIIGQLEIKENYLLQYLEALNGTHQLLVYADDVNILGDDMETIKRKKHKL
jgi:hypothetical protein